MKLKLECSHEDFHSVTKAIDQTRDSAETVKVPRAALSALLRDHGKLITEFKNELEGVL